MSEEQLNAFLEKVKADTSLQEKLKAASNADAVVEIAKASGSVISIDDIKQSQMVASDDELEAAVGGGPYGGTCLLTIIPCGNTFAK